MMRQRREPAWWILYGVLPLMGGLFVVESRVALPVGWRTWVQIGIILFIYSLVWIWLWGNDLALLDDGQDLQDKDDADTANHAALRSLARGFTPRQVYVDDVKVRPTPRRIMTRCHARRIRKCSHSLGRRSFRSRS
jgi:hypothetical protein